MRRPVDVMAANGMPSPRQAIWDGIRHIAGPDRSSVVTLAALIALKGTDRKTTRAYLAALAAGGYLGPADEAHSWRLLRDAGVHAPRLHRDGTPVTQGAGMQNMWRSMRMLAKFSALDIAVHSTTDQVQVSEGAAKFYCSILLQTGYLRVLQKACPPQGRLAVYRLIRNDGPEPPMIQRVKQIFDPNTGKVYRKGGAA